MWRVRDSGSHSFSKNRRSMALLVMVGSSWRYCAISSRMVLSSARLGAVTQPVCLTGAASARGFGGCGAIVLVRWRVADRIFIDGFVAGGPVDSDISCFYQVRRRIYRGQKCQSKCRSNTRLIGKSRCTRSSVDPTIGKFATREFSMYEDCRRFYGEIQCR